MEALKKTKKVYEKNYFHKKEEKNYILIQHFGEMHLSMRFYLSRSASDSAADTGTNGMRKRRDSDLLVHQKVRQDYGNCLKIQ